MTIICYRDGVMAADSRVLGRDFVRGNRKKIARTLDGGVAGAAGQSGACADFERWVADGMKNRFCPHDEDFGAIIVAADGTVQHMDHHGALIDVEAPFHVQGCAEAIAIGAMAHGATAEEAVRICIEWDAFCGAPVQVERVEQSPRHETISLPNGFPGS